jgi:hypothetical protein
VQCFDLPEFRNDGVVSVLDAEHGFIALRAGVVLETIQVNAHQDRRRPRPKGVDDPVPAVMRHEPTHRHLKAVARTKKSGILL